MAVPTLRDAHHLLQLLELTTQAVHTVIAEWAKLPAEQSSKDAGPGEAQLPSRELFEAQRTLISASGMFTELVATPSQRLLEVSSQYNESRCLHIAAELRVADIIARAGNDQGVHVRQLSAEVGIENRKLGTFEQLMHLLCPFGLLSRADSWFILQLEL